MATSKLFIPEIVEEQDIFLIRTAITKNRRSRKRKILSLNETNPKNKE